MAGYSDENVKHRTPSQKIIRAPRIRPDMSKAKSREWLRFPPIAAEVSSAQTALFRGRHVHAGSKATVARASGDTAWRRRTAREKARRDSTSAEALSRRRRGAPGRAASSAGGCTFGAMAQRVAAAAGPGPGLQAQILGHAHGALGCFGFTRHRQDHRHAAPVLLEAAAVRGGEVPLLEEDADEDVVTSWLTCSGWSAA